MPPAQPLEKARIDRWLWAVRLFRTRTLAAEACRSGKVRIDGRAVKPARIITADDVIDLRRGFLELRFRVVQPLEKRVGAKLVEEYREDLTPEEEYLKLQQVQSMPSAFRAPGTGRPTKKDRRAIDEWLEALED